MYPQYYNLEKEEIKDVIYHYTTLEGLKGIIEDNSIWATKISYLNDSSEYRIAIELMKKRLSEKSDWCAQIFEETLNTFGWLENPNVYVCSFSEKDDSLSQWRAYSKNSVGISIGFKTKELEKLAKNQNFTLSKCVYFPQEQINLIDKALLYIFDLLQVENKKHLDEIANNKYEKLTVRNFLLANLENIAPVIKDKGFYEEAELRLISVAVPNDQEINFNMGDSFIKPYIKFNLGDLDNIIDQVIIGPSPHRDLAIDSCSMFLENHKISSQKISPTSIPYRNW